MDAFRLSLIVENSRLCYLADNPDCEALIKDTYRKHFEKEPGSTLEAIEAVARVNVIRNEYRLI